MKEARDRFVKPVSSGHAVFLIDGFDGSSSLQLWVTHYDMSGWNAASAAFDSRYTTQTLETFLAATLDVLETEASELATLVRRTLLPEWERNGGPESARHLRKTVNWVLIGIAFVLALAAVGIVLTVWMLVR